MKTKFVRIMVLAVIVGLVASLVSVPLPVNAGAGSVSSDTSDSSFVYASGLGDPITLDPALQYDTSSGYVTQQVYEGLVGYDRDKTDQLIPMLADSWTVSPDGLIYTFHIRSGVSFHNGNFLTAEDAAYTFWRGLLQGGSGSPQWLLAEPLLGAGIVDVSLLVDPSGALMDNRNGMKSVSSTKLVSTCNSVKSKITYDNSTGKVVFHLAQPWSPFLETLAGTWGSILDKDWTVSKGGWSGDCSKWQDSYAMQDWEDPLNAVMNGTGPFKLDHWTAGSEIVLLRNATYWRNAPMWPDGPSGAASLQQVTIQPVVDEAERVSMLLNGSADMADITDNSDHTALDGNVLVQYDASGTPSSILNPSGTLLAYNKTLAVSATDGFFNYAIKANSPYIGSGQLDDTGIPADFFTDIHVRKAFNYAFNWEDYINEVFGGHAIQRTGPIIQGVAGYDAGQPHYSYNPAQAASEFNLAFGGAVAANGFSVTVAYNTGNLARQKACEILKANIEAISPKYHITILSLPWNEYLTAYNGGLLPLYLTGWQQDISHPHNWVKPYLSSNGIYSGRQHLSASLTAKYDAKINDCLGKQGIEMRSCYEDIQTSTYEDAVDIFLAQGMSTVYMNGKVRGYYNNPMIFGPYLYALSKGALPTVTTAAPETPTTVSFDGGLGSEGSVSMPVGSVSTETKIVITPGAVTSGKPDGFWLGNQAFDIQGYQTSDGSAVNLAFADPVTLTLSYTDASRGSLVEGALKLFYWNGSAWVDAACGPYVRDLTNHTLTVPVCHFSKFALGGTSLPVYLPFVSRL